MKNSILIILIIFYQILFLNKTFGKEIEFDASDIEISNNQNLTIANNGIAIIKDDTRNQLLSSKLIYEILF